MDPTAVADACPADPRADAVTQAQSHEQQRLDPAGGGIGHYALAPHHICRTGLFDISAVTGAVQPDQTSRGVQKLSIQHVKIVLNHLHVQSTSRARVMNSTHGRCRLAHAEPIQIRS